MVIQEIENVKKAAQIVWDELFDGHDEDIYEKAFAIVFDDMGLI